MESEHKVFGKIEIPVLKQGILSRYLIAVQGFGDLPVQTYHGEALKVAIKQELVKIEPELKAEDVDDANPGAVRWYSEQLAKAIGEATRINPE